MKFNTAGSERASAAVIAMPGAASKRVPRPRRRSVLPVGVADFCLRRQASAIQVDRGGEVKAWIASQAATKNTPVSAVVVSLLAEGYINCEAFGLERDFLPVMATEFRKLADRLQALYIAG